MLGRRRRRHMLRQQHEQEQREHIKPPDFPGACNPGIHLPDESSQPTSQSAIESMANLMKAGLKEMEQKQPNQKTANNDNNNPVVDNKATRDTEIVFAAYDMADETGQIVQPCDYEEPISLANADVGGNTGGNNIGGRSNSEGANRGKLVGRNAILASYEFARQPLNQSKCVPTTSKEERWKEEDKDFIKYEK